MKSILIILLSCLFWIQTSPVLAQLNPAVNDSILPQDPEVQVFFNHNQSSEYIDPYRGILKKGDNLEQIAIDAISKANSIDLAFFEFRLPLLAHALIKRHQAGAKIRLIIDNRSNDLELVNGEDALTLLKEANIPIVDDTADQTSGSGLMHHKFMIIDNKTVITGSANMTPSGLHGDDDKPLSRGNANHLLKIKSPELAQIFSEEFDLMWGTNTNKNSPPLFGVNKPIRQPKTLTIGEGNVTIIFSPVSTSIEFENTTNGLIANTLKRAQNKIDLALFVFSEQKIADVMEKRHNDGVEIRALIDPGFAYRDFSEGLDLLGLEKLNRFCQYENDNNPWQNPITMMGVPDLPDGDILHHKYGIIDNQIVITGSHNWSNSANHQNDEALLVIDNQIVANHFTKEFNRLAENAQFGVPEWVKRNIEANSIKCELPIK